MTLTFDRLLRHALATLRDPRAGARAVMELDIPRAARWQLLLLATVLTSVIGALPLVVGAQPPEAVAGGELLTSPFLMAAIQFAVFVLTIFAMVVIGRRAGGTGTLDDALILMVWLQFILIGIQLVQTAIFLLVPALAALIGWISVVLSFWLLTNFIAEMHGFRSLGAVFLSMLAVMVGFAVLLSLILGALGLAVMGV